MTGWLLAAAVLVRVPAVDAAAPVKELHQTMMKPASEAIFNVGRVVPKTDAEWLTVSRAGIALVEAGTLLRRGARPVDSWRWSTLSRQLAAAGRRATWAADVRNGRALIQASDRLVIVCETCHARYRHRTAKS